MPRDSKGLVNGHPESPHLSGKHPMARGVLHVLSGFLQLGRGPLMWI